MACALHENGKHHPVLSEITIAAQALRAATGIRADFAGMGSAEEGRGAALGRGVCGIENKKRRDGTTHLPPRQSPRRPSKGNGGEIGQLIRTVDNCEGGFGSAFNFKEEFNVICNAPEMI